MKQIVFLLFISTILRGQAGDSLLEPILAIGNDTERVNQLYHRGFNLRNHDPALAFKYARYCEQSAERSGSQKHLAKSYNLLGVLYYKKGDLTRAIGYHKDALKLRKECGDTLGTAFSQTNLGNIYVDLKLFALAEKYQREALVIYQKLKDARRTANALINIGALKQHQELQDSAFKYYQQAFDLGEKLHDYDIRTLCLNNMAIVFYKKGEYPKAIAYNHDAMKLRELMDNNVEMADSYLNLAACYIKLEQFENALDNIDLAYNLSKKYQYYEAEQEALKVYAEYYEALNEFEDAYGYLKLYYKNRDSVLASERANVYSNALSVVEVLPLEEKVNIHNGWLIWAMYFICVGIPYYFMSFKR